MRIKYPTKLRAFYLYLSVSVPPGANLLALLCCVTILSCQDASSPSAPRLPVIPDVNGQWSGAFNVVSINGSSAPTSFPVQGAPPFDGTYCWDQRLRPPFSNSFSVALDHEHAGSTGSLTALHGVLVYRDLSDYDLAIGGKVVCDNAQNSRGDVDGTVGASGVIVRAFRGTHGRIYDGRKREFFLLSCFRSNQDFPLRFPQEPRAAFLVEELHPDQLVLDGTVHRGEITGDFMLTFRRYCGRGNDNINGECDVNYSPLGQGYLGDLNVSGSFSLRQTQ
jgi:hypothetical protein